MNATAVHDQAVGLSGVTRTDRPCPHAKARNLAPLPADVERTVCPAPADLRPGRAAGAARACPAHALNLEVQLSQECHRANW